MGAGMTGDTEPAVAPAMAVEANASGMTPAIVPSNGTNGGEATSVGDRTVAVNDASGESGQELQTEVQTDVVMGGSASPVETSADESAKMEIDAGGGASVLGVVGNESLSAKLADEQGAFVSDNKVTKPSVQAPSEPAQQAEVESKAEGPDSTAKENLAAVPAVETATPTEKAMETAAMKVVDSEVPSSSVTPGAQDELVTANQPDLEKGNAAIAVGDPAEEKLLCTKSPPRDQDASTSVKVSIDADPSPRVLSEAEQAGQNSRKDVAEEDDDSSGKEGLRQVEPPDISIGLDVSRIEMFGLSNYHFGRKDTESKGQEANGASREEIVQHRMKRFKERGMRRSVAAVLLVHDHNFPHVLLLQQSGGSFALPGGRLRAGESEAEGLKRKLSAKLSPVASADSPGHDWDIGDELGKWWDIDFSRQMFPYIPTHVTKPAEQLVVYSVTLPESFAFAVPRNQELFAVSLYDLHGNTANYGSVISSVPSLLSRICINPR